MTSTGHHTMRSYHCDPSIKSDLLAQLAAHRAADEIVKGQYWKNGKGCAVGCTLHSGDHAEYEPRYGIPQMLARLEDCIFEGLPNAAAQHWPERFSRAVPVGVDLSRVGWRFLHWLLTDDRVNLGINDPFVRDAGRQCADVIVPLTKGKEVDESAAWSAASAARSAARSAAWSAESAESAAYVLMADKLIELLEAA